MPLFLSVAPRIRPNTFKSKPKPKPNASAMPYHAMPYFDNRIIKTIASTILLYDAKSVCRNAFGMKRQIMRKTYRSKVRLHECFSFRFFSLDLLGCFWNHLLVDRCTQTYYILLLLLLLLLHTLCMDVSTLYIHVLLVTQLCLFTVSYVGVQNTWFCARACARVCVQLYEFTMLIMVHNNHKCAA